MPEQKIARERNAAGRMVPVSVNGRPQVPFQGVGAWRPEGRRAAPPVRSSADYPADGDRYRPVWEFAQTRQLPVLIHTTRRGQYAHIFTIPISCR